MVLIALQCKSICECWQKNDSTPNTYYVYYNSQYAAYCVTINRNPGNTMVYPGVKLSETKSHLKKIYEKVSHVIEIQ